MDHPRPIAAVLAEYPLVVREAVSLGHAGGFSGSEFWRVSAGDGRELCLRRWAAEHPSPRRLQYIHHVLTHVRRLGLTEVAAPLPTRIGATFVAAAGHLWELSPWMPGKADYLHNPSPAKLAAAMDLLARFHVAAASCGHSTNAQQTAITAQDTLPHELQPRDMSPSPGVLDRLRLMDSLLRRDARRIEEELGKLGLPEFDQRARQILDAFFVTAPAGYASLQVAAQWEVALQPCIRDVWHDHILFSGEKVTGVVDFGALREECVAADIARLLGSLVFHDQTGWRFGLEAYQQTRCLSEWELRLVRVFRESNILLSGMNWLRWIYLERRQFPSWRQVVARLDCNLRELRGMQHPGKKGA